MTSRNVHGDRDNTENGLSRRAFLVKGLTIVGGIAAARVAQKGIEAGILPNIPLIPHSKEVVYNIENAKEAVGSVGMELARFVTDQL